MASLNWLVGKPAGQYDDLSQAQRVGVEEVRSLLSSFGPPDTTAAAALYALRGHKPGYDVDPVTAVVYTEGAVSVPTDSVNCDAGQVLQGDVADMWHHWDSRLLRPAGSDSDTTRPHFDQKLRR